MDEFGSETIPNSSTDYADDTDEKDPEKEKTAEAQYSQFIRVGRIGRPEEAAGAVLWLCSDAASYVSGHSMRVDGGLTSWAR